MARGVGKWVVGGKIPKHEFQQWVEALRSGKYEQTTGKLMRVSSAPIVGSNPTKQFCCLGVGCSVSGKKEELLYGHAMPSYVTLPEDGSFSWLANIEEDFLEKSKKAVEQENPNLDFFRGYHGPGEKLGMGLTALNDTLHLNFDEIADILELVYVHRAWD